MLKFTEQLVTREFNIRYSFVNKYISTYYMSGTMLGTENKTHCELTLGEMVDSDQPNIQMNNYKDENKTAFIKDFLKTKRFKQNGIY